MKGLHDCCWVRCNIFRLVIEIGGKMWQVMEWDSRFTARALGQNPAHTKSTWLRGGLSLPKRRSSWACENTGPTCCWTVIRNWYLRVVGKLFFYLRGVGTDSVSPSFPSPRGKLLSLDLRKPCRLNSSAFCHLSCHGFSYAVAIRHTSLKHLIQGAGLGTESPRSNPGFEARVGPQHFGWLSSPLTHWSHIMMIASSWLFDCCPSHRDHFCCHMFFQKHSTGWWLSTSLMVSHVRAASNFKTTQPSFEIKTTLTSPSHRSTWSSCRLEHSGTIGNMAKAVDLTPRTLILHKSNLWLPFQHVNMCVKFKFCETW